MILNLVFLCSVDNSIDIFWFGSILYIKIKEVKCMKRELGLKGWLIVVCFLSAILASLFIRETSLDIRFKALAMFIILLIGGGLFFFYAFTDRHLARKIKT
jgi:hypothetical protein